MKRRDAYLVPENGQLPTAALTLPEMLSPDTVAVKASVSGMGLLMSAFQEALLPSSLPSQMSVALPLRMMPLN